MLILQVLILCRPKGEGSRPSSAFFTGRGGHDDPPR